jgi:predicted amidophosphoribosyltransferase
MTVSCSACGQEWPRDPALEVRCPTCCAKVGHYCSAARPSGYRVRFGAAMVHPARDQLAMDLGFLQRCPAAIIAVSDNPQLSFL